MTCGVCRSRPARCRVIAVDALDELGVRLGDPYWLPVCSGCDEGLDDLTATVLPVRSTPLDEVSVEASNREG